MGYFDMQVRIEKMRIEHIESVCEIEKASFPSPWTKTIYFQEATQEYSDCFVLIITEEGIDQVAAYVSTWTVLDECTINKIACRSDLRRRGLGRMIIDYLINDVYGKAAKNLFIEVRVSNHPAIAFYKKSGFVKIGVREGYYSDTKEDAIIMSLDIGKYFGGGTGSESPY